MKKTNKRFEERVDGLELAEAVEGGARRLKVNDVIVAGVINGNQRRYPSSVIEAAVTELRSHLNESAGSGRIVQVLGEAEHPSDKSGRSNLLETVVRWDDLSFDGRAVGLGGFILGTSKGKDILAIMEGGVRPGVSLRGYGDSKIVKEAGRKIEEVTDLHLTGFDLVMDPSFENSANLTESQKQTSVEDEMSDELLEKLQKQEVEKADLSKRLEEAQKLITEAENAKAQLEESQRQAEVKSATSKAIEEACKDLPFGKELNEAFIESLNDAELTTPEAVKKFAESKRKEYGKFAANGKLAGMGFTGRQGIHAIGSVLENETGTPEFARPAFELVESMSRREMKVRRDLRKGESSAELLTVRILERFDTLYKAQLIAEAKLFTEAELTTDLNLPYSVSRAIIEEVFPNLVAANIFDMGMTDQSPMRLFYESFIGESGYAGTLAADEVVVLTLQNTWYDLAHGRITPGTVVVKNVAENVTYVENTDYAINYAEAKIKSLVGGALSAATTIHITAYSYTAIRQGEMAPIERGKITLAYLDIAAKADRLATQISREAIVFSRSLLGMDAVARTLASLIRETRRKIDQGMLYMARTAVMSVPNNSAGAWVEGTTQADYGELVRLIGASKVLVGNRYYEPNFILCSLERAEDLSNWDGFKRDGFPNAILSAAGFAGSIKGLPIFQSTEFPNTEIVIGNRELVMYRVFQPMRIFGPYPSYDVAGGTDKLVAAEQYYTEEFNVTVAPVQTKGAYLTITEGS